MLPAFKIVLADINCHQQLAGNLRSVPLSKRDNFSEATSQPIAKPPSYHEEKDDAPPMSPKKKPIVLRCPTCKTIVTASDEDFPFCSDRCRKIDLGKWASGAYKISSPILDPDILEDLESGSSTRSYDDE
jgi:endogenous inhibitor of DNA gyrase (YacG/DUF329 family)